MTPLISTNKTWVISLCQSYPESCQYILWSHYMSHLKCILQKILQLLRLIIGIWTFLPVEITPKIDLSISGSQSDTTICICLIPLKPIWYFLTLSNKVPTGVAHITTTIFIYLTPLCYLFFLFLGLISKPWWKEGILDRTVLW